MTELPPPPTATNHLVEFIESACGIAVRATQLDLHQVVAQHKHTVPHATFVSSGAVRMWANLTWVGDFIAPALIEVPADLEHLFQALQPHTHLACLFKDNNE